MKTKMMLMVFVLITALGYSCYGQRIQAVFPARNYPPKDSLIALWRSNTPKGKAFKASLIESINEGLNDTAYKVSTEAQTLGCMSLEEVYEADGAHSNSGYDTVLQKMVRLRGDELDGMNWVWRTGTYKKTTAKYRCGNVQFCPVVKIKKLQPKQTQNQTPGQQVVGNGCSCTCPICRYCCDQCTCRKQEQQQNNDQQQYQYQQSRGITGYSMESVGINYQPEWSIPAGFDPRLNNCRLFLSLGVRP